MAYKRTYWANGSVSINADRMNNIELGILEIESELNKLKVGDNIVGITNLIEELKSFAATSSSFWKRPAHIFSIVILR